MNDLELEEKNIIFLPKEEWEGTVIPMRYTTEEYYDVQVERDDSGFYVRMQKKTVRGTGFPLSGGI